MQVIEIEAPYIARLPSITTTQGRTLTFEGLTTALKHAESAEHAAAVLLANASVLRSKVRAALNDDLGMIRGLPEPRAI